MKRTQDRLVNGGVGGGLVAKSCPTLTTPCTSVRQAPLSMGFPRQEYWSGFPFPFPGDLPDPGIEPRSPALQADSLPSEPPRKKIAWHMEMATDSSILAWKIPWTEEPGGPTVHGVAKSQTWLSARTHSISRAFHQYLVSLSSQHVSWAMWLVLVVNQDCKWCAFPSTWKFVVPEPPKFSSLRQDDFNIQSSDCSGHDSLKGSICTREVKPEMIQSSDCSGHDSLKGSNCTREVKPEMIQLQM